MAPKLTPSKKERLSRITSEIKEFHPLLEALLRKLPNVVNIEYTHGPTEMGADFVLSRSDPTLNTLDHIGVIVKIGPIVQDFSDIERQIDECSLARTILGGKEKIRLSEIWIVTNENITKGAQDKIHEKYLNRKISFIEGSRLVTLIDQYLPMFWTDVSIEAGEYLTTLRARNEEIDRSYSLIQLSDKLCYIDQDIYEYPRLKYRNEMRRKQKNFRKATMSEIISQPKLVLIEGGMGSGKSKLLRQIVSNLTDPETFLETKVLPVVTTYSEVEDSFAGDIGRVVEAKVPEELRNKEVDLTFLLLIDAIDEKQVPNEDQVAALAHLVESLKKVKNTRVIVTSRYLRGLDETCELESEICRYHLPPLTLSKMVEFIKVLCTNLNLSSRIVEDLRKSQIFQELPHSPIAAILLAKLLNENPKDIPSNMTELYSQYMELILGRWDIDKGIQTLKEYKAMEQILMQMAKVVLDYEMPFITLDDSRGIIEDYLKARNLDIETEVLFNKLISRCEVLAIDHQRRTLTFKHRTFAEYFYAKEMLRLNKFNPDKKAFDLYWMNTVFFYIGILKDCPEILTEISGLPPQSETERWLKFINMANYYLAGYASPYETVIDGVTNTILDAARLFNEITNCQTDSPIAILPHMHLLCLMQMLIRDSYSFQYFKDAIESAALRIDDSGESNDVKAIALFFLNVAYIDLGATESFDFLLNRYSDNLPLDIALAIRHEGDNLKVRSALMKKQDKRIRKLLRGNQSLQAYVDTLYERPIRETKLRLPEKN